VLCPLIPQHFGSTSNGVDSLRLEFGLIAVATLAALSLVATQTQIVGRYARLVDGAATSVSVASQSVMTGNLVDMSPTQLHSLWLCKTDASGQFRCEARAQAVAAEMAVPADVLYAVALQESRAALGRGVKEPWPFTLNARGVGYCLRTRSILGAARWHVEQLSGRAVAGCRWPAGKCRTPQLGRLPLGELP